MSIDTPVERSTKVRRIEADLVEAARHCKRQMRMVRRFTKDPETDWDAAHRYLDLLLDDWQAARL